MVINGNGVKPATACFPSRRGRRELPEPSQRVGPWREAIGARRHAKLLGVKEWRDLEN